MMLSYSTYVTSYFSVKISSGNDFWCWPKSTDSSYSIPPAQHEFSTPIKYLGLACSTRTHFFLLSRQGLRTKNIVVLRRLGRQVAVLPELISTIWTSSGPADDIACDLSRACPLLRFRHD